MTGDTGPQIAGEDAKSIHVWWIAVIVYVKVFDHICADQQVNRFSYSWVVFRDLAQDGERQLLHGDVIGGSVAAGGAGDHKVKFDLEALPSEVTVADDDVDVANLL